MTNDELNEAIKARIQTKLKERLKKPLKRIHIKELYEFYKSKNDERNEGI